jgi:hypothetical protein
MSDDSNDLFFEEGHDEGRLQLAQHYGRAGLEIFPVHSITKSPMPGYGWLTLASRQVNHITEDFLRAIELWGEDNVSIAWKLGENYVALDFDVKPEPAWASELEPAAMVNITKRGRHFVFANPLGVTPGNGVSGFPSQGWGEVRGAGGYIIIGGPDRPGLDVTDWQRRIQPFPFPEWLTPYGGYTNSATVAQVVEFAQQHTATKGAQYLNWLPVAIETQWVPSNAGIPGVGRHPLACEWLAKVAEEAQLGLYPFQDGVTLIKRWWNSVVPSERGSNSREWAGMLTWAVGRALARSNATDPPTDVADEDESRDPLAGDNSLVPRLIREAIDWNEFWTADTTIAAWLIDGFWPLGKKVGVYAKQSEGKSEWALWCALMVVTGVDPGTGERIADPAPVLYLDYEMDWDDLRDRLESYGVTGGLDQLTYDQFPTTGGVDTDAGRQAILEAVDYLGARAVIIDTYGMAIEGPENDADTALKVARDLGNPLKSRGVGMLLIVHPGRDVERGARGSSALAQQMDVMWMLNREPGSTHSVLSCTGSGRKRRQSWVPSRLVLDRSVTDDGTVRYSREREIAELVMSPAITALVTELEDAGIDPTMTQRETQEALGRKPKTKNLAAAMRYRREFYERYPQGKIAGSSHLSTGNQGVGDDDDDDT